MYIWRKKMYMPRMGGRGPNDSLAPWLSGLGRWPWPPLAASMKKTIPYLKKKSKESENWLCIRLRTLRIAHLLRQRIFLAIFSLFYFVNFLSTLSKQSIRTQKIKIWKLSFHGVQNIAQLFVTKTQFGYFWGGRKWGLRDVN